MVAKQETFLGCIAMEAGGKIVGWITLMSGLFVTLFSVALFTTRVSDLYKPRPYNNGIEVYNYETRACIDAIIGFLGTIIGCAIVFAAAQLVDGSNERKSKKTKPAIGLYAISMVFTLAANFTLWPYSLVPTIINWYIIMFLFSLRNKLKEEEMKNVAQEPVGNVTISQPLTVNNFASTQNPNDPAILTINPNVFECYTRPTPVAPPTFGEKF